MFGRLAGYEDVNDADRLALDPVMRQVVGGRAVDAQAASPRRWDGSRPRHWHSPRTGAALADLNGQWIDRFHDRNGLKYIVLDMDSSVSPTLAIRRARPGTGIRLHLLSPELFVQPVRLLERCALRHGNVHSADGWRDVLDPVIARYAERDLCGRFFRADAAYAIPRSMSGWKKPDSSTPSGCLRTTSCARRSRIG